LVVSSSDSVTSEDSYSSLLPMLRGVAGPGVEAAESFLVFSAPLTAKKVLVKSMRWFVANEASYLMKLSSLPAS
jgi:hypothetical protein